MDDIQLKYINVSETLTAFSSQYIPPETTLFDVSGSDFGNVRRYIEHSEEPNLNLVTNNGRSFIVAHKAISKDSKLTLNKDELRTFLR